MTSQYLHLAFTNGTNIKWGLLVYEENKRKQIKENTMLFTKIIKPFTFKLKKTHKSQFSQKAILLIIQFLHKFL